jgi:signal transduction histidine kinase
MLLSALPLEVSMRAIEFYQMPKLKRIAGDAALTWVQIAAPVTIAVAAAVLMPDLQPVAKAALAMTGVCGSALTALSLNRLSRAIKLQQDLELKAHQQRDDFLSVLLHNMKGPLIGATHTLEAIAAGLFGEIKPEVLRTLDIVKRSNQELLRLSESLVGIYRLENEDKEMVSDRMDLNRLISRVYQEMEGRAIAARVTLRTIITGNLPNARGDSESLAEVLTILVDNAVNHSRQDSVVEIRAKVEDRQVIVEVADSGRGMSQDEVDCLFKTFWQGTKERPYAAKIGLSLYYAFRLVQASGGRLTCESNVGEGTTFSVTLPLSSPTIAMFPTPVVEEACTVSRKVDAGGA